MPTLARKIVISCHWSRSSFIAVWKLDPTSHTGGRMLAIPKKQSLEVTGQPSYIVAFSINRHHHRHHQWYLDHWGFFFSSFNHDSNPLQISFKMNGPKTRQWMLLLGKPWPRLGWLDAERTCFKPRLPGLLQRKQGNFQHKILVLVWCWTFE